MFKEIFFVFKALSLLFVPLTFASDNFHYNYGEYIEVDHVLKAMPPARPSGIPFTSAVMDFGKAVVKEGETRFKMKKKPWSSWWYPKYERDIFEDSEDNGESTLRRYDRYARKLGHRSGSSRDFEEAQVYDPHSSKWSGLCHAWAVAAIMEEEPKTSVRKRGVKFRVRDLKALLIKTYENSYPKEVYGQRNNGSFGNVYEDLYPEQFHTIINAELFDKKRAFIMDFDAGYQVWNVPVYGARIRVKKDAQNPNVVHVQTLLNTSSPFVKPDFVGTEDNNFIYTYDLYGNWIGNKFVVDYGIWTERSRRNHPDFIAIRPEKIERVSENKFIKTSIVDQILEGSR